MHLARGVSLALFALALAAGCGGGADDAEASSDVVSRCGSTYGDAVLAEARSGPSTVPGDLESRANRVVGGPIVGGREIGDAIYDLVTSAKRDVVIEFFDIDESSWLATRMRDAIRALPPAVHVSVLVNPIPKKHLFIFPEKPGEAEKRLTKFFGAPNLTAGSWDVDGMLGVLHSKVIVVDGARALVTDSNVQKQGDPEDAGGLGWFQLAMIVEGRVAATLRAEAVAAWAGASQKYAPPALDNTATSPEKGAAPPAACTRMIALGRDAEQGESSSANLGYMALLRAAKHQLRVITPNLNDDHALRAIADATERADVEVLLSKGFNDGTERLPFQGGTNAKNVGRLAGMAKNACNLHIRWFARGGRAVDGNGPGASHAKWASADGRAMILGSQNLDTQSWKKSRELGVAVDDAAVTAEFDRVFDGRWNEGVAAYECK